MKSFFCTIIPKVRGATAKIVGCSKSTALYWVKKWGETKNLNDEQKPGRNWITTLRQDAKILKLASDKENVTAVEIQQEMEKQNISTSVRTIQKRLHEDGAKYMAKLPNHFSRRSTKRNG